MDPFFFGQMSAGPLGAGGDALEKLRISNGILVRDNIAQKALVRELQNQNFALQKKNYELLVQVTHLKVAARKVTAKAECQEPPGGHPAPLHRCLGFKPGPGQPHYRAKKASQILTTISELPAPSTHRLHQPRPGHCPPPTSVAEPAAFAQARAASKGAGPVGPALGPHGARALQEASRDGPAYFPMAIEATARHLGELAIQDPAAPLGQPDALESQLAAPRPPRAAEAQCPSAQEALSGDAFRRKSRRSLGRVNYSLPSIRSKLRQGDPFTFTLCAQRGPAPEDKENIDPRVAAPGGPR